MAMPRPRLRASRTNQPTNQQQPQLPHGSAPSAALPRLPTGDLPPRLGGGVANVQLRRLQEHQRHLEEMERLRRDRQERVRKDDRMEEQKQEERSEEEQEEQQMRRRDQVALQLRQSNGGPGCVHVEVDQNQHPQQSNAGPLHQNQPDLQSNSGSAGPSERRLELQLDHEQQIRQWQQELEDHGERQSQRQQPPPTALLSPSSTPSALGTIYEALEAEMEEEDGGGGGEENRAEEEEEEERSVKSKDGGHNRKESGCSSASQEQGDYTTQSSPLSQDYITQNSLLSDMDSPISPEQDCVDVCSRQQQNNHLLGQNGTARHPPHAHQLGQEEEVMSPELDWGSKAGLVQQLISQTLLLVKASSEGGVQGVPREGLSQGANHGTLSPLESSHWPQLLLSPLTNPSTIATVTAVSSYAPQATHGNTQPQGEWTVVEVETHH